MNFEEFYNSSFSKVYKFFYYKFVPKDEVEDLSQDVFIRFYKKYALSDLDKIASQRVLYGICRNVYKEWVRKQIKEKNVSFLDNYEYEIAEESTLDDHLIFASETPENEIFQDIDRIKEILLTLSENVRKVLEYRFLEGKTRKETAELLGIKEKDVHTYQKRGIKYLKKILTDNV